MASAMSLARLPLDRTLGSVVGSNDARGRFALTYDDGPEPQGTEQVLRTLDEAGARATFFVLVRRVRAHRALWEEVLAAGHEVALHGIDHRRLTDFSAAEVRRRTRDGRRELEDLSGRAVRWFRPPYGHQRVLTTLAVRSLGLESVLWGAHQLDWQAASTQERVAAAVSTAAPGVVLLAHDGYASADVGVDDGPRPEFDRGDLARRVLAAYAERGLQPCTVGELLDGSRPSRRLWRNG